MLIAIIRKTFENHNKISTFSFTNQISILNKFALKSLTKLSYNKKMKKPLVASFLLNLLNNNFLKIAIKTINIILSKTIF